MLTAQCFDCGDFVRDSDAACAHCARPVDRRPLSPINASNASLRAAISLEAQVCILFGALAVMVAPFLPWAILGTRSMQSLSGLDVAGPAALLLPGLGLLMLRASIASLRRQRDCSSSIALITAAVAGCLSWLHFANLRTELHLQVGPGLFACAGGCVLLLIGIAGSLSRRG